MQNVFTSERLTLKVALRFLAANYRRVAEWVRRNDRQGILRPKSNMRGSFYLAGSLVKQSRWDSAARAQQLINGVTINVPIRVILNVR
jgi:hypothetical protein